MTSICILIDGFYPLVGGLEGQAFQVAGYLAEQGYSIKVVTRRPEPDSLASESLRGFEVYRLSPAGERSHWRNLLLIPRFCWFLWRYRQSYDCFYVFDVRALLIVALVLKALTGKRIVVQVPSAGDVARRPSASTVLSLYSQILRRVLLPDWLWHRLLKGVDAWIALSHEIEHELSSLGLPYFAIPIAINTARFKPPAEAEKTALRQALGLPSERFILVYHGRIAQRKRLDVLLRALAGIVHHFPHILVLIIGDVYPLHAAPKDDLAWLSQQLGLAEYLRFLPATPQPERYLMAADGYALPSEVEGMPHALLEAMACRLPILASRIGGIGDILDESSAWLLPPGDVSAWQSALVDLLSHAELARQKAENACKILQEEYTEDVILRRYIQLFESVC